MLKEWWRKCLEIEEHPPSLKGKENEVLSHIRQLNWLVKCWHDSEMTHDKFTYAVLDAQRLFQGVDPIIWEAGAERVNALVADLNLATKRILAVYDAIELLKEQGYERGAPLGAKRFHLSHTLSQDLNTSADPESSTFEGP